MAVFFYSSDRYRHEDSGQQESLSFSAFVCCRYPAPKCQKIIHFLLHHLQNPRTNAKAFGLKPKMKAHILQRNNKEDPDHGVEFLAQMLILASFQEALSAPCN